MNKLPGNDSAIIIEKLRMRAIFFQEDSKFDDSLGSSGRSEDALIIIKVGRHEAWVYHIHFHLQDEIIIIEKKRMKRKRMKRMKSFR